MSLNANALTTRQRVMDFMGISSLTTVQQNVMDRIINSVSEFLENFCGRTFKLATYTEEFGGNGARDYVVKHYPITAITSVQYRNSDANENSWTSFDSEDYFYDLNAGTITMAYKGSFMNTDYGYRITYTAGFNFDNSTTFLSDVGGADLEYAVWKLVVTAYDKKQGESGVESESIGDYSVTYSKTLFENSEIKEIIGKYKGFGVGSIRTPAHY